MLSEVGEIERTLTAATTRIHTTIRALVTGALLFTATVRALPLHAELSQAQAKDRMVAASYEGVVPTLTRDGVVEALVGAGDSPFRIPVADGASAAFGISHGVLLYRVDEDLYRLDFRSGQRARLLRNVLVVTAAWQPKTENFAAVVRTPTDFALIVSDATIGDVTVVEKAAVRPEAIRWNSEGNTLYYVATRGGVSELSTYGDNEHQRSSIIDENAVRNLLTASDDDLRRQRTIPSNESERGSPELIARTSGGVFAQANGDVAFYPGGVVTSSNAIAVLDPMALS